MNNEILKEKVKNLSSHLQQNVRTFRGKEPTVTPKFQWQQLLPVVIVLAGVGILAISPKTRNSVAVKLAMLVGSLIMQGDADDEEI